MPSSPTCPEEAELLPLAMGDPVPAEVEAHVAGCAMCQSRLEREKADLAFLRAIKQEPPLLLSSSMSPSTLSEPMTQPAASNGQVHHSASSNDLEDRDAGSQPDEAPLPPAIGKYLVVGRFPPTGQAEVFRVVHPGLARDLVLKLALKPVEPGGRHEIVEEGKILADLKHPNLVQIYDLDFHEDRPYLVMEYIRGRNLDQLASEGRLKPRQVATLLAKVAAAVDYAHRHGVIHRDIKPKNILVDEAGEPRLIDFGMARFRTAWSEDPGKPGGTFAFMAPEQARVESAEDQQKVGPRTDVFALGAVLYFLLTGKAPFDGETWRACWSRAHRCDFDRKALDAPKVPRELRRICLKAMAVEPADRFGSAEALQKALKRYLQEPIVRNSVTCVAAVALLWGLVYLFWTPTTTVSTVLPATSPAPIPITVQPTKGRIDLLVVKSKDGRRRRLRLEDRGAVPVHADDEIRIEARLDRPAYLYLFWLGSEGKVAPLYPWKDHDWSTRPAESGK